MNSDTLIESLLAGLTNASKSTSSEVPPACILWTDAKGEWLPLIELLRSRLPQLLCLGEYNPEKRTGPAIWLKCAIENCLPEFELAVDQVPIVYLPKVNRQILRAGTECPVELQPIVELQYRGVVWTQKSGRDWTVEAMLVSKETSGLGLDVAGDKNTKLSLMASLSVLADTPVTRLQGRKLEAEDFDKLMIDDHPRDLLRWMNDPRVIREHMDNGQWYAFCNRCREDYGFDPSSEGELVAGEKLGLQPTKPWERLWGRFREAPATYSTLPDLLRRCKPSNRISFDREAWPDENDRCETDLRTALATFEKYDAKQARAEIQKLEEKHGVRRTWVWAKLGESPLADSLEHLVNLAERSKVLLSGDSSNDLAKQYAEAGYLVDDAALRAFAAVKTTADSTAVQVAVRSLYLNWMEHAATRLQQLWTVPDVQAAIVAESGTCILFADGLRYDLAQRLSAALLERGLRVEERRRWSALPSVTATAKPAVSPVAGKLRGVGLPDSFSPELAAEEGKSLTFSRLQSLLKEDGYQIIGADEVGDPTVRNARGWCEFGDIDRRGHSMQIKLASIVQEQVDLIAERIVELNETGWQKIRVVTDHGWLLMPGGLPKEDLPSYLTEAKWARCATIKGSSKVGVPKAPWFWNGNAEFAVGPGIKCFSAGHYYAHGGISLQECLIADLTISRESKVATQQHAVISKSDWKGLRCRITVAPANTNWKVDLRTKPNDPNTSISAGGKPLDSSGTITLFVENEDLLGSIAAVVICDQSGNTITKQGTTVGGE